MSSSDEASGAGQPSVLAAVALFEAFSATAVGALTFRDALVEVKDIIRDDR